MILAKAGVRKGPGNKLAESSSSFKNKETGNSDSSLVSSTEVKLTANGRRLQENGVGSGSRDQNGTLEVVVEGVPSRSSVGRHPRSPRLDPLPVAYTSKHTIPS